MGWAFLNVDEVFYQIHLLISGTLSAIWYVISFQWVFNSSAARNAAETGQVVAGEGASLFDRFISSGIFRILYSRPSATRDSLAAELDPVADKTMLERVFDILLGTADHQSVFSLIFSSALAWIIIIAILFYLFKWWLGKQDEHVKEKGKLVYEAAQANYQQTQANDKAERWRAITEKASSESPSGWKVAVLDADILLEEVLTENGFAAGTIAEQLRLAAVKHDVDPAGTAHGIRNKIAHDASFELTHHETKRAISLYETFFNDIYYTS